MYAGVVSGIPKPNVLGYLRVSTDRQAEEGHGLDVQRLAINKWAKAAGDKNTLFPTQEEVNENYR